jgi:hypothetical protein
MESFNSGFFLPRGIAIPLSFWMSYYYRLGRLGGQGDGLLFHFMDSSLFWPGGRIGTRRQNRREESFLQKPSWLPPREARAAPEPATKSERYSAPGPMESRAPHYGGEFRSGPRAKGTTPEICAFFPHAGQSEVEAKGPLSSNQGCCMILIKIKIFRS